MLTAILNHHDINTLSELIDLNQHKVDVFEIRLDYLITNIHYDLQPIRNICHQIKKYNKKIIFTLRSQTNYGLFTGSEPERLLVLLKLADLQPNYIDLEYDADSSIFIDLNNKHPQIKIISSYHHNNNNQEEKLDLNYVNSIFAKILNTTQDHNIDNYKLIFHAHNSLDNFVVLKFLSDINQRAEYSSRVTAHCMGEQGLFSRILGKRFGNKFTYCLLNDFTADLANSVNGIKADELLEIYNYRNINQHTQIYCLIGNPVSSSVGHLFHNKYYKEHNINAVYIKILVNNTIELDNFFEWFKILSFAGCSVTMPYKTCLADYLNGLSTDLSIPINTIKNINNNLYGINTDGEATVDLLLQHESDIKKMLIKHEDIKYKKILVLGAGGAAHGIVAEFSKYQPKKITIVNRSYDKAEKLIQLYSCEVLTFNEACKDDCKLDSSEKYDYIINTISFNLDNIEKNILTTRITRILTLCANSETLYLDINYNHHENIDRNCMNLSGYQMYVRQAIKQINYWLS